jgi:hypothetical protein
MSYALIPNWNLLGGETSGCLSTAPSVCGRYHLNGVRYSSMVGQPTQMSIEKRTNRMPAAPIQRPASDWLRVICQPEARLQEL